MKDILKSDTLKGLCFGILLTGIIVLFFKKCDQEPKPVNPINLKTELKKQDSFRTIIRYHDSTRLTVLKKYKDVTRITDSMPCYTEIKFIKDACDTVILHDSILIGSLYGQHKNDSTLFVKTMAQKNDTIKILKKEIKKQKWQKRGITALWVIREAVGVGQKIKN